MNTKKTRIYWTEEEQEAVIQALMTIVRSWPSPNPQNLRIPHLEQAQMAVIDKSRRRHLNWTTLVKFMEAVKARMPMHKKVEPAKTAIPVPAPMKKPMTRLAKPTTLDLQITGMVRSELQIFEKTITLALLERIKLMLGDMEQKQDAALKSFERRVMQAWGIEEPAPVPQALPPDVPEMAEAKRLPRVLVACLRADQHQLVHRHLGDAADQVQLTILEQDVAMTGLKKASFDKVYILSKFIGHAMSEKVLSRFGREKCTILGGAALSAAMAIKEWLEFQKAGEWMPGSGQYDE